MNPQHISTMLRMQGQINSKIDPDWLGADYPWHRAMYVEAVEALDLFGWKWWKLKPTADQYQIQLELVDIWHFAMSNILAIHEGDLVAASVAIQEYFDKLEENPDCYGEISTVHTHTLFDLLAGSAALQRQLNGPAFNVLMGRFNLTWDKLYEMYVGKNVLNTFRQDHGYKDGTYQKEWGGVEDNTVLESLMVVNPDASPETLMDLLERHYQIALTT
jgi:dimeric dUTPase (all-alpha-NTP-PPase superfamily)